MARGHAAAGLAPWSRFAAAGVGLAALALLVGCQPILGPSEAPGDRPAGGDRPTGGDSGGDSGGATHIPSGPYLFAISASDADPSVTAGEPREGIYSLWVWLVSGPGGMSALEADIEVTGDAALSPVFSASPPNLGLVVEGGADVLLAVPFAPEGPTLLGSLWIEGAGGPATVRMVGTESGGVVDCNVDPGLHGFTCQEYVAVPPGE